MEYAHLNGRGAILVVVMPTKTREGQQALVFEIERWLRDYDGLDGYKDSLPTYQAEGLKFLYFKLQERRTELRRVIEELEA